MKGPSRCEAAFFVPWLGEDLLQRRHFFAPDGAAKKGTTKKRAAIQRKRPRRFRGQRNVCGLERAAQSLLALDGFKQGLEVAFAKALGAASLDDFKKYRGAIHDGLGEQLQ